MLREQQAAAAVSSPRDSSPNRDAVTPGEPAGDVSTTGDVSTPGDASSETASADVAPLELDFSDLDAGAEFSPGPAVGQPSLPRVAPSVEESAAALPGNLADLQSRLSDLLADDALAADEPSEKPPRPTYVAAGRGGVRKLPPRSQPADREDRLDDLLGRMEGLLGETDPTQPFRPAAPTTIHESGLNAEQVERLVLKFLANKGSASGREVASQLRLPFTLLQPLLKQWKDEHLIGYRGSAEMGDYRYQLAEAGRTRAAHYSSECTYFGAAPVSLADYLEAMEAQSIARQQASRADLQRAFSDLLIHPDLLDKLGPAINSGRGMFLFGEPGNGKTSVAERITACFGSAIWIPRTLGIDGEIMRLYDPGVHEAVDWDDHAGLFDLSGVDQRWIRVVRPTVIAGGELTMSELEVAQNPTTHICESPLQLKSNCGTLVIDDFGRQTMPIAELLNRWIVPLEKRYDFLCLPSGKKIQVPFDQLIIFSTNLEPRDLVDGAFLRRIPYKIEVPDPLPEHFRELFRLMAPGLGLQHDAEAVEYLIATHYEAAGRTFKACHPRDLMLQVRNRAVYRGLAKKLTPEGFDFAVENYFSVT